MSIPKPSPNIASLKKYESPQIEADVRLNTNESPLSLPAGFTRDFLRQMKKVQWNRYPDRSAMALREALAEFHKVRPEQIFAANGSNEVLQTLLLTYAGSDGQSTGKTGVFEPTYGLHTHIPSILGSEVIKGERDENFMVGEESLQKMLEQKPSVLLFCSPNNPTGILESAQILELARSSAAASSDFSVVVDSAYGEFGMDDYASPFFGGAEVDDEVPFAVIRTFSKVWGLAGVRLGYMIGPAEMVENMYKAVLPYHLSVPAQAAGITALSYSDEMAELSAQVKEERERVMGLMKQLSTETGAFDVFKSDANFLLIRLVPESPILKNLPVNVFWRELCDKSVIVRNCDDWSEGRLKNCLRITIGTKGENNRFLDAFGEILKL